MIFGVWDIDHAIGWNILEYSCSCCWDGCWKNVILFNTIAVLKRVAFYSCHAIRDYDACESLAVFKCTVSYFRHAVWNRDA